AIEIDPTDALPPIEQQFYETSSKGKIPLLQRLLSLHQPSSCVVFCNTKKDCQAVCDALNEVEQSALSLHGDLEQRDQTLVRLANGSARVLDATDVAARGLDIKSLVLVVNFELAWDPEVHVLRIGRTARAGNSGLAISFCAPEEAQRANIISDMLQIKLNWQTPPANSSIVTLEAEMATLCIDGGKKAKMRPGDVLGALIGDIGLDGAHIGKIAV
nr:helicase-related protein [Bacillus paranthracis]